MAKAYKCDRCGAFFEHDPEVEKDIKYRMFGGERDPYYMAGYAPVHLCSDCSKKLHEWMDYKPEPVVIKGDLDALCGSLKKCVHNLEEGLYPRPTIEVTVAEKKKRWWQK